MGDGSFCLLNLDSKTTLTFFGTYNASSALTFAKSRQCLRMSVQCVDKTFESRSKLTQHSIQTHEEKKCDECGNMFKKANFARHLKVHTGRSVLTCEECGKTFNRTDGFRKHVNRFHEETAEHECGDCKKTFSQKWYLKDRKGYFGRCCPFQ